MNSNDSSTGFSRGSPPPYHPTDFNDRQESISSVFFIQPSEGGQDFVEQANNGAGPHNDNPPHTTYQTVEPPPPYPFNDNHNHQHHPLSNHHEQREQQCTTVRHAEPQLCTAVRHAEPHIHNLNNIPSQLGVTIQSQSYNHDQQHPQPYNHDQPSDLLQSQTQNTNTLPQHCSNSNQLLTAQVRYDPLDKPPPYSYIHIPPLHNPLQHGHFDPAYHQSPTTELYLTRPHSGSTSTQPIGSQPISVPNTIETISMNQMQTRSGSSLFHNVQQPTISRQSRRSYTGVTILSCIVFWFMFPPLGLPAFILAVLAGREEEKRQYAKANKYSRYSKALSGLGIISGVILLIALPLLISIQHKRRIC